MLVREIGNKYLYIASSVLMNLEHYNLNFIKHSVSAIQVGIYVTKGWPWFRCVHFVVSHGRAG